MVVRSEGALRRLLCLLGFAVLVAGCSGGDGDDDVPVNLTVTFAPADTTTYAAFGVICVPFTVTGIPNSVLDLLAQYLLAGSTMPAAATPAPAGLGNVPPSSPLVGVMLNANGTATGTFYWYAGADLGFLPAQVQFCFTPFVAGAAQPAACSTVISFGGGAPAMSSMGPGAGSGSNGNPYGGTGRALHSATMVRPTVAPGSVKDLLVAGGYNDGANPNAFNTGDRFDFSANGANYTIPFSGDTQARRVLHGSSFFLDPMTGLVKVLVAGGVTNYDPLGAALVNRVGGGNDLASAAVYCFSPTEQVVAVSNLASTRFGHSATWTPSNQVVILGGATSTANPVALSGISSIEHFNPATNTFGPGPNNAGLTFPRVEHASTLLADGRVFVAGGYDPANPTMALMCEVYDPIAGTSVLVTSGPLGVRGHTVTRLANGWVVIVGGRRLDTGAPSNLAYVYRPEGGGASGVLDAPITMDRARAFHSATLLGNRNVLISGGITSDAANPMEQFTTNSQIFRVPDCFSPGNVTGFVSVNPLTVPRAEHSAANTDCGSVFVIGGRNNAGMTPNLNFLDSVEFYAFSNAVPMVASANTSASGQGAGTVAINFNVTDANNDGGYVVVRYRTTIGSGPWSHATISSQTPSSLPGNFPNHEVCVGNVTFIWNFAADGVGAMTPVEIQLIPFGAVIGTPMQFLAATP